MKYIRIATATVGILALLGSMPAHANLQKQLDNMFGSMTNVTSPGSWSSARRGVLSGGSITIKNRISSPQIVSFVPPSFEAGCGGLSLHGGSFSYINAEEFINTLRNVASNAAGFAFQIALDAMAPDVMQTLNTLQQKMQQLNQMFRNSCQAAQEFVDWSGGKDFARDVGTGIRAANAGWLSDVNEALTSSGGSDSPNETMRAQDPAWYMKNVSGNFMWRALRRNSLGAWFAASGPDEIALLEAIMNMTDTIVISRELEEDATGEGRSPPTVGWPTGDITPEVILMGSNGNLKIYGCGGGTGEDECLQPVEKTIQIKGLNEMILDKLRGNPSAGVVGIITKLRTMGGGDTISVADKEFVASLNYGVGAMLMNLVPYGERYATHFAEIAAPHIAFDMMQKLLNDIMNSTYKAVSLEDSPHKAELLRLIREAQKRSQDDYALIQSKIGPRDGLFATYERMLHIAEKPQPVIVKHTVEN